MALDDLDIPASRALALGPHPVRDDPRLGAMLARAKARLGIMAG